MLGPQLELRGQIGEELGQVAQHALLEGLVVGEHAGIPGDLGNQSLGQPAARILTRLRQVRAVHRLGPGAALHVQRILEGDLLVGAGAVEGRYRRIKGFEIEMAERIPENAEEVPDAGQVDRILPVQGGFNLEALRGIQAVEGQIFQLDDAALVIVELLDAVAFEIEDRILGNMLPAEPLAKVSTLN